MPTVPSQSSLIQYPRTAVSLARYASIIQMPECQFWGVSNVSELSEFECGTFWTKQQRDITARYLSEAQDEIENEIGFFLQPTWVAGTLSGTVLGDRFVDSQRCGNPLVTRWGKLIEAGVKATTNVALSSVVDHTADPAVVGPIATLLTDTNEIYVYHPGTGVEITPSSITISGGFLTINIPRCRMLKELPSVSVTSTEGWDYTDLSGFESTVDVKRIWNDPSVNAELVWSHGCTLGSSCGSATPCQESTRTGCMYIMDYNTGVVSIRRSSYSDGIWGAPTDAPSCLCGSPETIRLNYLCGTPTTSVQAQDTIVRLAHAEMPTEFCGCSQGQLMWKRDRDIPKFISFKREACPFGVSDGAWTAYRFSSSMRLVRAFGTFGRR